MPQKYRIGCSGYYYPYWKLKFYPKGVSQKNWLSYYSTVFNSVEMNGTFYRQPKPPDLLKYYTNTPGDFSFSVKMSRYITHAMKLKNASQTIAAFQDLILNGLKEKLTSFLFQMPPEFIYTEENLTQVLTNVPHAPHNVIEFRHESWWQPKVLTSLKKASITFCNVDFPGKTTPVMKSGEVFYQRLHGSPVLFTSSYSDDRLKKFISQFPKTAETCHIYFNNTSVGSAFRNARTMMELLKISR